MNHLCNHTTEFASQSSIYAPTAFIHHLKFCILASFPFHGIRNNFPIVNRMRVLSQLSEKTWKIVHVHVYVRQIGKARTHSPNWYVFVCAWYRIGLRWSLTMMLFVALDTHSFMHIVRNHLNFEIIRVAKSSTLMALLIMQRALKIFEFYFQRSKWFWWPGHKFNYQNGVKCHESWII